MTFNVIIISQVSLCEPRQTHKWQNLDSKVNIIEKMQFSSGGLE